jgi:hypothetical protein
LCGASSCLWCTTAISAISMSGSCRRMTCCTTWQPVDMLGGSRGYFSPFLATVLHKDLHEVAAVGIRELLVRKFSTTWSEVARDRCSNKWHLPPGSSDEVWQQRSECTCSRDRNPPTSSSCSLLSFFADFLRSESSRWAWISDRRSAGGAALEGMLEKCHVQYNGLVADISGEPDEAAAWLPLPLPFFLGSFAAASLPLVLAAWSAIASSPPERRCCRIASAASTELGVFF